VTPAGELLAAEIRSHGALHFSRFMDVALYDPLCGYYRRPAGQPDPFGVEGDFYTAAQLQPVFGRLVAAWVRRRRAELGNPQDFAVVEWGAGRGELASHLGGLPYFPVDAAGGNVPPRFQGVVFSNELFDALPVDVVRVRGGEPCMMCVGLAQERFAWVDGPAVPAAWQPYVERALSCMEREDELWLELPVRMRQTLEAMAAPLARGFIAAIDYGYTERELVRFPRGTLMSYRRHRAVDDVLLDPGLQDITAHVPFTHLEQCAASLGLSTSPLLTLARFLMDAGEADQFAGALAAPDEREAARLRLQLKSLLFGMGETFRCVTLHR
jgi:SAM-dependent MidA family methyltransferase